MIRIQYLHYKISQTYMEQKKKKKEMIRITNQHGIIYNPTLVTFDDSLHDHHPIYQKYHAAWTFEQISTSCYPKSTNLSPTVPDRFHIERKHRAGGVSQVRIKPGRTGEFSSVESVPTSCEHSLIFSRTTIQFAMNRTSFILSFSFLLLVSASAWPFRRRDVFDNAVDSPHGVIAHLQHFGELLYRNPDNETGTIVANWHEGWDRNPEELGNYAEGDILFPPQLGKNGLKAEAARWPGGVVPYMISPYFGKREI